MDVVILDVDREKERVSLGLKQMSDNPWEDIERKFPIGQHVKGKVTKLLPYGAFVEIETRRRRPRPRFRTLLGQAHHPPERRARTSARKSRPSCSASASRSRRSRSASASSSPTRGTRSRLRYPIGTTIKGPVRNLTAYGAFVELEEGIDGMIHVSDMSWTRKINHPSEVLKKSDEVEAIVLAIDKANQRVSPRHQADSRTIRGADIDGRFKVGDLVKGTVAKIATFGAFVSLEDDIDGLIHISQLSEDHVEKVKDIIKVGDEVEARVIKVDKVERRIGLSIKAVDYSEEQLKKESASFESLRPSTDMVGLEQAFNLATEEWSPGDEASDD